MGSSPRARFFTVFGVSVNVEAMIYKILFDRNRFGRVSGAPGRWLVAESPVRSARLDDHYHLCTIF